MAAAFLRQMSRSAAPIVAPPPSPPPALGVSRPASILSPVVDFLCVGGLSLIVFIPLLLSGRSDLVFIGAGAQAWLGTAINMPHFMASYRLVYRSRESILRHKWASIYVPAILLVYIALALWEAQYSPVLVIILISVSSAYLAWHYTGQVWGMMASYAYLGGTRFEKDEKFLIRTSLRILLAWHVTWFLYTQLRDPSKVRPLYFVISAGTVVAFVLGADRAREDAPSHGQASAREGARGVERDLRLVRDDGARSQGDLLDSDRARAPVSRFSRPRRDQPNGGRAKAVEAKHRDAHGDLRRRAPRA